MLDLCLTSRILFSLKASNWSSSENEQTCNDFNKTRLKVCGSEWMQIWERCINCSKLWQSGWSVPVAVSSFNVNRCRLSVWLHAWSAASTRFKLCELHVSAHRSQNHSELFRRWFQFISVEISLLVFIHLRCSNFKELLNPCCQKDLHSKSSTGDKHEANILNSFQSKHFYLYCLNMIWKMLKT